MEAPKLEPKVLPENYRPEGASDLPRRIFDLFRDDPRLKHRPRSPEKAAWLREHGIDPDRPFGPVTNDDQAGPSS